MNLECRCPVGRTYLEDPVNGKMLPCTAQIDGEDLICDNCRHDTICMRITEELGVVEGAIT